jgi:hypothetical protein
MAGNARRRTATAPMMIMGRSHPCVCIAPMTASTRASTPLSKLVQNDSGNFNTKLRSFLTPLRMYDHPALDIRPTVLNGMDTCIPLPPYARVRT